MSHAHRWLVLGIVIAQLASPGWGELKDVKVTTDRSIDCSSMETIARDLYRDCETDEDKAIATWYFVRRQLFHWPKIPTWNPIDLINSYGFGLCGHQSRTFAEICQAGGLKARTLNMPGHVIAEVYYDGAWHMFDCQVGWFAWRKDKSAVASCAEMKADPTIVTDAVEEGRASQPYFQCSDDCSSGTRYAAGVRPSGSPKVTSDRIVINLRRGESITRRWGNEGKAWHKDGDTKWTHPRHGCTAQAVDQNDPVNWPYWKPYAQKVTNKAGKEVWGTKRYFGNGRMVYHPDLRGEGFHDGLAPNGLKNVAQGNANAAVRLHPAEAGKPAEAVFTIACPYIIVDAWLDAKALRTTAGDDFVVQVRQNGKGWQDVYNASETGELDLSKISLKDAAWASKGYEVKFIFRSAEKPGDVGLKDFTITTVFMNNMYSLPYFMPGKNVVKVTASEGADLSANPLTLEYVWEEQGQEKTLSEKIDTLPFETTVEVAGEELPRMKSVKLSVEP